MKKKIKRFLPVLACFVLLSGLFAMPVSAVSSGWSQLEFSGSTALPADDRPMIITFQNGAPQGSDEFYPYTISTAGQLGSRYTIGTHSWLATSGGQMNCFRIPVNYGAFEVQAGDVIRVEFTDLFFYLYDSRCEFFTPFLGLSYDNRTFFVEQVDPYNHPSKTGTTYSFSSLVFEYTAEESATLTISYFLYSFTTPSTSAGTFSADFDFVPRGVVVSSSGNPTSPEYPKYNKPDDGGAVGDLEDLEGQFDVQSQQGMDSATDTFNGFGTALSEFTLGLQFVSVLMRTFIFKMPWLNALFTISLGLGLFGFIVGLAGYALGAADRKASREARRSEREARRRK